MTVHVANSEVLCYILLQNIKNQLRRILTTVFVTSSITTFIIKKAWKLTLRKSHSDFNYIHYFIALTLKLGIWNDQYETRITEQNKKTKTRKKEKETKEKKNGDTSMPHKNL